MWERFPPALVVLVALLVVDTALGAIAYLLYRRGKQIYKTTPTLWEYLPEYWGWLFFRGPVLALLAEVVGFGPTVWAKEPLWLLILAMLCLLSIWLVLVWANSDYVYLQRPNALKSSREAKRRKALAAETRRHGKAAPAPIRPRRARPRSDRSPTA